MTASDYVMSVLTQVISGEEGFRQFVYDDKNGHPVVPGYTMQGHPTVGWGRALDTNGISQAEGDMLRQNDIQDRYAALGRIFPWFTDLGTPRQAVLVSMAFNVGVAGLQGFKEMIAAIEAGDFTEAQRQMLDSHWARDQVPARAQELSQIMASGVLPT